MNDILIKNARLKLKKKFKKNKLGGKGTMRRKIIKKCNITSTAPVPSERNNKALRRHLGFGKDANGIHHKDVLQPQVDP